jgi:hypothetical protein
MWQPVRPRPSEASKASTSIGSFTVTITRAAARGPWLNTVTPKRTGSPTVTLRDAEAVRVRSARGRVAAELYP